MRNEIEEILDYFDMEVTALTEKERNKMENFLLHYDIRGK